MHIDDPYVVSSSISSSRHRGRRSGALSEGRETRYDSFDVTEANLSSKVASQASIEPLTDFVQRLHSEESLFLSPRPAQDQPRPYPWKWAYGDGALWGRFKQCLFGGPRRFICDDSFINPIHIGVVGQDIGVYGQVKIQDYIGYVPIKSSFEPERQRPLKGWFSGISKVASRLVGIASVVMLGMISGFALYRPTLYIEADISSVALFSKLHFAQVNTGVKITGSLQFELAITNPSYMPQQLLLHSGSNSSAAESDPFNDTTNGAHVIGLLVPYSTSNASLYQPLGFATPASTNVPLISPRDAITHVAYNLTVHLDSQDKNDGFAVHLAKPLSLTSSESLIIECGGEGSNAGSNESRLVAIRGALATSKGAKRQASLLTTNAEAFIRLLRTQGGSDIRSLVMPNAKKEELMEEERRMGTVTAQGTPDCETILDLYLDQCKLGFVLIEAAIMHLTYQYLAGGVYAQLFRTNPFPVPCEISTSNTTSSSS